MTVSVLLLSAMLLISQFHMKLSPVKNPLPCDVAYRQHSLTTCDCLARNASVNVMLRAVYQRQLVMMMSRGHLNSVCICASFARCE